MLELKTIFEEKIQNLTLLPRRFSIKTGRTHLYGPPRSGKTTLALLFAKPFKNPVYIDCDDPRNDIEHLTAQILKAFLEKKIDVLILDNYKPLFTLPNLKNIIIITQDLQQSPIPQDFYPQLVLPLNFEEYISLIASNDSLNQLLNRFIKDGNMLENFHTLEFQKIHKKQNNMRLFFQENYPLFLLLLPFQAQKITINQLYLHIKKYTKVSKDKLYAFLFVLQEQKIISLLPHKDFPNRAKKLYFYDFSLPYPFCKMPNFQAIFENMVFLELQHQYQQTIFYSETSHFYIDNKIFFALPFPNPTAIQRILEKNPHKDIIIIAINKQEHQHCKIIDFVSFALKDEME